MSKQMPDGFILDERKIMGMRDYLCDATDGDCPSSGCKGCLFDAELPEFVEWLRDEIKNIPHD